jgi:predicted short-subunit dehydrogenase-like oxidoreductase (DUF2520 family)
LKADLAFIGAGVVGSALGIILKEKNWPIKAVNSRTEESARRFGQLTGAEVFSTAEEAVRSAEVIFLTVPDMVIEPLGEKLKNNNEDWSGKIFFHCSGSLASTTIAGLRDRGARVASLHPLQSFARYENARSNLPGSVFSFEGDPEAEEIGREIVRSLGGEFIPIRTENKVLYHTGACMISNYTVALAHAAIALYQEIGFTEEQARGALLPLLQGTTNNLCSIPAAAALTGPIARGDWAVVEEHLQRLATAKQGIKEVYRIMGKYTVDVALEKGSISGEQVAQFKKLLG